MQEHEHGLASPVVVRSVDRGVAALRWGGFWSAVALPLVHVPLLVVEGLSPGSTSIVLSLWLANVVALVVGRRHAPHGRARWAEVGDGE
jgi:hypothetical protein